MHGGLAEISWHAGIFALFEHNRYAGKQKPTFCFTFSTLHMTQSFTDAVFIASSIARVGDAKSAGSSDAAEWMIGLAGAATTNHLWLSSFPE